MREYQERMMREMQKQREEHEKQLMEQKLALLKHQVGSVKNLSTDFFS